MSKAKKNQNYNDREDYDEGFRKSGTEKLKVQQFKPRTERQAQVYQQLCDNDISFMFGPAGTGKTFFSAQKTLEWLKSGQYDNVVLSRPAIEVGGTLGFLPGDLGSKVGPYMVPILQNMKKIIGEDQLHELQSNGIIEFLPMQFMQGWTWDNTIVILDELQNATKEQLKMALTRIGVNCKLICTLDPEQCCLDDHSNSCIVDLPKFKNVQGIGFIEFTKADVVRSKMCKLVVSCYEK